jgi:hypothetical protein
MGTADLGLGRKKMVWGEARPSAYVDFCGEHFRVPDEGVLTIGREGDVAIDDNPFLHRRFLELSLQSGGILWIANVGASMTTTIADEAGLVQSWLSPGAALPLLFPRSVVWFTAGPTTYEFDVVLENAPFTASVDRPGTVGDTTVGRITFTPDQKLLILALAEDVLRRGNRGAGAIPPSARAAERLGWTITKFNRKLDNVCEKLAKLGIRGLVSDGANAASNRRARLVEYALATRLVTADDLEWMDAITDAAS